MLPVVFVAITIGMIWALIREYRNSASRKDIRSHFQQIAVALDTYHDQHGCFPPAYVLGPDGQRRHSWRVLLLPYLGHEDLYRQYRTEEPWNSPHNQALAVKISDIYLRGDSWGQSGSNVLLGRRGTGDSLAGTVTCAARRYS